jgi:hypothetical protein
MSLTSSHQGPQPRQKTLSMRIVLFTVIRFPYHSHNNAKHMKECWPALCASLCFCLVLWLDGSSYFSMHLHQTVTLKRKAVHSSETSEQSSATCCETHATPLPTTHQKKPTICVSKVVIPIRWLPMPRPVPPVPVLTTLDNVRPLTITSVMIKSPLCFVN